MAENKNQDQDKSQALKSFEKKLDKIKEGLDIMKQCGIDDELLIAWLQARTKFSRKDIKLMLDSTEDFYYRLIKKEMFKKMTSDNDR